MIESYGGLTLWGPAFLLQLLATFGVMAYTNLLYWAMVWPIVYGLLELAYMVLSFLAYN